MADLAARLARWAPLAISVALWAPLSFDAITESDAGFHVAVGRLILAGHFPRTNALSWFSRDFPWGATSWLFDAACATLDQRFGPLGLQVLELALGLATLGALDAVLRRGKTGREVWFLPALAVLISPRLTVRPHVATWAVLGLVLLLCLLSEEKRPGLRWLTLPVLVLGANLHAGAIFPAFVAASFFGARLLRHRQVSDLLGAVLATLAVMVTPSGWYTFYYLFLQTSTIAIREYAPARLGQSFLVVAIFGLCVLAFLRDRVRHLPLFFASLVLAAMSLYAQRMIAEFLIVAAPLASTALATLSGQSARRCLSIAALTLVASVWCVGLDQRYAILHLTPAFDPELLPVRAARLIEDLDLRGHGFNSFDDGGYLAYALPGREIFIDGRYQAYPPTLFESLVVAERTPDTFDQLLRSWGTEWALVERRPAHFTGNGLLDGRSGWALLYFDDFSELFVRRDVERFRNLIARDELKVFRPWEPLLNRLAELPNEQLGQADQELRRLQHYSPDDPLFAVLRCGLDRRSGSNAEETCQRAAELATGPVLFRMAKVAAELPADQAAPSR